jgi:hypothetical protein
VPEQHADEATAIVSTRHEGARRIGTTTDRAGSVEVPSLGLRFPAR